MPVKDFLLLQNNKEKTKLDKRKEAPSLKPGAL